MDGKQKRIITWACPRSVSTAFYRAIANAPGTLGIFEPYSGVFGYMKKEKTSGTCTLTDITAKLNEPYADYSTIFVKEMAYCLVNKTAKIEDILPEGYIHTFLIRDPCKTVTSLYKMYTQDGNRFENRHAGHKEVYEMYTYLTSGLGLKCLVIDADDLQAKPEAVLTTYCEFVGIDFHPSMCNWNLADPSKLEALKEETSGFVQTWHKTVTTTSAFIRNNGQSTIELSSQPLIVQETIADNMPYYELMYAKRALIN